MKRLLFDRLIIIFFSFAVVAQQEKKSFKEEFIVNPNVLINIDTRHADVEVETWKKNRVVVEAFMMVEGENITNEIRDDFYKNWNFRAYGNKNTIKITSKSKNRININTFNFDSPDYSCFQNNNNFKVYIPDVSIGSLAILDSIDFEMPPSPPLPPGVLKEHETPKAPSLFDFEAYKKNKTYLEKWKKENEAIIGKDVHITIGKNAIHVKSDKKSSSYSWNFSTDIDESADKIQKIIQKRLAQREKQCEARRKIHEKRLALHKKRLEKRVKHMQKRRKEIQKMLKNRSNLKIKRFIKIKAPDSAKFKMNIKYGTVSFPNK